jgi:hypothetical protein
MPECAAKILTANQMLTAAIMARNADRNAMKPPNGMELTGGPLRGAQRPHAGRPC